MAIVEMKKMHLLGLRKEQDKILSILQKTGKVEIIEMLDEPDDGMDNDQSGLDKELSELDQKLTRLKFGIDFLKPYVQEKNPLLYGKPQVNEQDLKERLSDGKLIDAKLDDLYELDQRFSIRTEESS